MADLPPALMQPQQGQVQYVPAPGGGQMPSRSGAASPGFSGAILDLLRSLSQNFAPRSMTQRPQVINQAVDGSQGAPQGLGDQLTR